MKQNSDSRKHLDEAIAPQRTQTLEKMTLGRQAWLRWLVRQMIPNIGTVLLVTALLLTVPSLASPRSAPWATSTSTISYQGLLTDGAGVPLSGQHN